MRALLLEDSGKVDHVEFRISILWGIMAAVRFLFTLIMLLVIPLQLTFAAGAEYCESGKAHASHFGHHAHAAQDADGNPQADPEGSKSPVKHCSFCYLGCSQLQVSHFELVSFGVHPHYVAGDTPLPVGIPPGVPYLPPRSPLV